MSISCSPSRSSRYVAGSFGSSAISDSTPSTDWASPGSESVISKWLSMLNGPAKVTGISASVTSTTVSVPPSIVASDAQPKTTGPPESPMPRTRTDHTEPVSRAWTCTSSRSAGVLSRRSAGGGAPGSMSSHSSSVYR